MIVLDHNDNEIWTDAVYDWWIVAFLAGMFSASLLLCRALRMRLVRTARA